MILLLQFISVLKPQITFFGFPSVCQLQGNDDLTFELSFGTDWYEHFWPCLAIVFSCDCSFSLPKGIKALLAINNVKTNTCTNVAAIVSHTNGGASILALSHACVYIGIALLKNCFTEQSNPINMDRWYLSELVVLHRCFIGISKGWVFVLKVAYCLYYKTYVSWSVRFMLYCWCYLKQTHLCRADSCLSSMTVLLSQNKWCI